MNFRARALELQIREALTRSPAVFLSGPRQAGKSTLARHLVSSGLLAGYVTLDDITAFGAASADPEAFLRSFSGPVVVDEVQLAPGLFRILKTLIDERRAAGGQDANGRFLLTGSANVMALPGLSDALVGRMSVSTLYPFSATEILGRGKPVINGLFDQDITSSISHLSDGLDEAINRATFPGISGLPAADVNAWFSGYLTTLLQRDVRQLAEIEKIAAFPTILTVLAARAAGLLNDADSARDAKLNAMTYRRYRALLQQLFLITLVPPWSRNIAKRVVKSPKLYFADTALLCHQLGVSVAGLRPRNPALYGRVVENFVATELLKQIATIPDGALHHFRAHDGSEVDFVVERRSGAVIGIEVKTAESVTADDFKGLKVLKDAAGKDFVRGIVLYLGRNATAFGSDMFAMPLNTLWRMNMDVTTDKDVRYAPTLSAYIFWANYGDRTRLRCLISREVIDDHFHNNASEKAALSAINKNWGAIWPLFQRKIVDGRIESIAHDNGPKFIAGRHQTIRQVTLTPQDLGYKDFRKSA